MSLLLGKFVLFDVLNHFTGSNQSGNFKNLIDVISSMKEWGFIENLNKKLVTIPAKMRPADQISTL